MANQYLDNNQTNGQLMLRSHEQVQDFLMSFKAHLSTLLLASCWLCHAQAQAQVRDEFTPWEEIAQTPPAEFSTDELITVDNPTRSQLTYGVVPSTVVVGEDKVVRYVLVAKSKTGAMNVQYEGIRCDIGAVKVYANWRASNGWRMRATPDWIELRLAPSRYAQSMARDALCNVRIVYGEPALLVQRLRDAAPLR